MAGKRSCDINIPLDLTVQILKNLPAKSLARFQCVSKQWTRMIRDFIVIDSIVTRSLTQPQRDPHFIFERLPSSKSKTFSVLSYTYPHHQITNEEQLYHEEIFGIGSHPTSQYVRGLIGFWCLDGEFTIHNPTTWQSVSLRNTSLPRRWFYLFGYDPFKNQYKIMCLTPNEPEQSCQVLTLGDPTKQWRDIQCGIIRHFPAAQSDAVCINGTIYYGAFTWNNWVFVLVSFDVRSEKFNIVQVTAEATGSTLLNYQGKLGCICHENNINNSDVEMWVLENAEKKEWLKITFFAMFHGLPNSIRFAGVTHPGGEIIIVHQKYLSEFASDVYYYDPKRNSRRRVEIQTTTSSERIRPSEFVTIWALMDHVENIMRL